MSPPLRGRSDVDTCIAGLVDGTIDCIVTDHAPHAPRKKMRELDQAPFGIVGLETALGLVVTELIEPGHLDWPTALAKMTINPARDPRHRQRHVGRRRRRRRHDHRPGGSAGPSIRRKFHSKSANTPFAGWKLSGRADTVIVGGRSSITVEVGNRPSPLAVY